MVFGGSLDIYHTTFDWPSSSDVAGRLQEVAGTTEDAIVDRLVNYHRHIDGIKTCFGKVHKTINADQPKSDVFSQGMINLCSVADGV